MKKLIRNNAFQTLVASLLCILLGVAHHLLLLALIGFHLPVIGTALLLINAAALFLAAACHFLLRFTPGLLLHTYDFSAVGNTLLGGPLKLFLHVAAFSLTLGVIAAGIFALAAVWLFALDIRARPARAVASAVT